MPAKKKPALESRRCTQVQCSYYLQGGCKSCQDETCLAEPYIINTSCSRCLSCENVPGALRWDDPNAGKIGQQQPVMTPELEKEIMEAIVQGAKNRLNELEKQKPIEVPHER